MLRELRLLERRTHRSGRDTVDHPARGADDLANALIGALYLAVTARRRARMIVATIPSVVGANVEGWVIQDTQRDNERARDRIRLVHVDENGNELTADQACALRHGELSNRRAQFTSP